MIFLHGHTFFIGAAYGNNNQYCNSTISTKSWEIFTPHISPSMHPRIWVWMNMQHSTRVVFIFLSWFTDLRRNTINMPFSYRWSNKSRNFLVANITSHRWCYLGYVNNLDIFINILQNVRNSVTVESIITQFSWKTLNTSTMQHFRTPLHKSWSTDYGWSETRY